MVISDQKFRLALVNPKVRLRHVGHRVDIFQQDIAPPDTSEKRIPVGDHRFAGVVVPLREIGEGLVLPRGHHLVGRHQIQRSCFVTRIGQERITGIEIAFGHRRVLEGVFLVRRLIGDYVQITARLKQECGR